MILKNVSLIALISSSLALPAYAQTNDESDRRGRDGDDFHIDAPIVVTAPYVENLDILAGTTAISGDMLAQDVRATIGDTLTALPGVSATSFAPGASRPVLRGFQGPRIRVLTDGIGALDASQTSVDHNVSIDALTAQRVEVLRGPAVLLFGGSAIGGAVNVIDKRIPRDVPKDEVAHFDALVGYGTAEEDAFVGGSLDVALSDRWVAHVDGSYRDSGNRDIAGFQLSPSLRAEVLDMVAEEIEEGNFEEAEEFQEAADQRGFVPNSAVETMTAGAGLAFIDEGGDLGISIGYYDSDYGVPGRPGAEHHHHEEDEEDHDDHDEDHDEDEHGEEEHGEEEAPVTIAMKQWRADLRGGVNMGGFFERLNLRAGYSDYEHTEFEGDEVGTLFFVEGIEARAELVQAERNGWRGVIGGQMLIRDFDAVGAEAFIKKNSTEDFALFTVQEVQLGDFELEGAMRYEITDISSPMAGIERDFDAFSGALGLAYAPQGGDWRIGVNLSRAVRAPSSEELLSNIGFDELRPHVATQAVEIGNPDFVTEKSWGGELYARYESPGFEFAATLFANWFDDYIYEVDTGLEAEDLPIFQYFQDDATYWGIELNGSARLGKAGGFTFVADGVADYVRAKLDNGGGNIARIPPLRLLGGLEAQSDAIDLRAEVEWVDDQNKVAAFETSTEGFTMLNASVAWRPMGREGGVTLLASANNLLDENARRHASFTKDYVPLAGRDFRVSARFSF